MSSALHQAAFLGRVLLLAAVAAGCATGTKPMPTPGPSNEEAVMETLRKDAKASPEAALAHADDAEKRFGDSAFAEERRALAIQALIDLGRIGEARSRAYRFLERYPNGPYSGQVAAMTGVHVTPAGPGKQDR